MSGVTTPVRCEKHNGGIAPCLVLAHFPSMAEAQSWARSASVHEGTRFLVRLDAGRHRYDPEHSWEAIQTWLSWM
jgi:hypothetical protein